MSSEKYHLVLWTTADPATTSVLSDKDVKIGKKKIKAKWGSEWFEARIVKSSRNKALLDKIEVDSNGEILSLARRESFPDAITLQKRELSKEQKEIAAAKSKASKHLEREILETPSIFCEEDENAGSSTQDRRQKQPEAANHEREEINNDPEENDADMIDDNLRNENDEEMDEGVEEPRGEMNQQLEDADELVNEDNGNEEEYRDYELDRVKLVSFTSEEGKIKLLKGCKIYINSNELSYLKSLWRNKPFEFTRRLMKLIIGRKELRRMTPTGRAGTKQIPADVYKAVFMYVNKKVQGNTEKMSMLKYRRTLTNLCNGLRNPKKPKDAPKTRPKY